MTRLLRVLDAFWFTEAPAARLAVLRILIGTYAFWLTATHYDMWVKIGYSSPALFEPVGVVAVLGQPLSPVVAQALIAATLVANVLFVLGWRHRFTGPLFAALLMWILSYRQSWSMIYHSMNLPALHVLILGLAPAADALSLDARRPPRATRGRDPASAWQYGWPIRLICAVTVLAYLVTGVAKVAGPLGWSWATGEAMRSQVAADAIRKEVLGDAGSPLFYVLYDQVWLFTILGVVSLALELGAPLVLWNRRLGRWWALGAFLMHWGILFIMGIKFRYHLSGIIYASFFDGERLAAWCRAWPRRVSVWVSPGHPVKADAKSFNP
jgi:hypothetical protein